MKEKFREISESVAQVIMDILTVIFILVIITCIWVGYRERKTGELQFIFGYKPVYIVSGSMEETILKHSIVLLKEYTGEELKPGEIITYSYGKGYVTHRLVGIDQEAYESGEAAFMITKGDNNRVNDLELLALESVTGTVEGIFNLPGKIIKILKRMTGEKYE